jgi:hypothetical protein
VLRSLDRAGGPGLALRDDPVGWSSARGATAAIQRGADWRAVLAALGYELERRPRRGWLARHRGRPVAVVHPTGSAAGLTRLDEQGRPPEGVLLNDCEDAGVRFGLLVHAARLRLLQAAPRVGAASTGCLDLDAGALTDGDRPLLALLGPGFLADGRLAALQEEARTSAAALRRRLDETLRQTVLPILGPALGQVARAHGLDPADAEVREELERAALTLVFRALVTGCAEGAGGSPRPSGAPGRGGRGGQSPPRSWGSPDPSRSTGAPPRGSPDPSGGSGDPTLVAGELGHLHEGLLSLRLLVADAPLRYDARGDRYVAPAPGERADVEAGELLWQTHQGGRKGGGVWYTRAELVRHLVGQTVAPAFRAHLARVRTLAAGDPDAAATELLDFAVLDPACGGAHFLVVAVDELADQVVRFLGETPLPAVAASLGRLRARAGRAGAVGDVALLRRLLLEHCVFGVDASPVGAEVAALSLELAASVPGLPVDVLGRNVVVGNALAGVLRAETPEPLARAVAGAAGGDVEAGAAARLLDLWTAEPFGLRGARREVVRHGPELLDGRRRRLLDRAAALARDHRFLHWPLAFPRVFARPRPGFDAVVGNPPWEEVTVEALGFYGLFAPGLRGLPERPRAGAVAELVARRPELPERLAAARERAALQRRSLERSAHDQDHEDPMPGDPDLYKAFCRRYRALLRDGGTLGVVLPRSAFAAAGSAGFRRWLFEESRCRRLDFLLNRRCWIFDTHPQYTVALLAAERAPPSEDRAVRVAGTATTPAEWERQAASPGLVLPVEALGPRWTVPLLRGQAEADLLARLRRGTPFPYGAGGRWRCFPVAELHETGDRHLWAGTTRGGRPLWKGAGFEQYDPHGAGARRCPPSDAVRRRVRKPRPGSGSRLAAELDVAARRRAVLGELGRARVAFRDVSRATDARTVRACFVPPGVLLTNKAPYLAFAAGDDHARAACLGIMNSLPFDWQARRFVEINLSFFILEGLVVPDLDDDDLAAVAASAARLSCADGRFVALAEAVGVEAGPLGVDERQRLRVEIDARVARAWSLTAEDLDVLLADFTLDAVPGGYRRRLAGRLAELSARG